MRRVILPLLVLLANCAFSLNDTIHVTSDISDVTVFFEGAQIHRQADLHFPEGRFVVSVDSLPMNINEESIQVKGIEHARIVSIQMLRMLEDKSDVNIKVEELENLIEEQTYLKKELESDIEVYALEKKLLLENIAYSGNDQGTKIEEVKEAATFYRAKLKEINAEKLKLKKQLKDVERKIVELSNERTKIYNAESKPYNQILVGFDCEISFKAKLKLNYYIEDAGWEAEYDFRVEDINQPLTVVHNASIYQLSGEDWEDVNLTLSTEDPSLNNELPELTTWRLGDRNYKPSSYADKSRSYSTPSSYSSYEYHMTDASESGTLKGRILDSETKEPIPFANVVIEQGGRQCGGGSTDFDGYYTIKPIAPGMYTVKSLYVGYQPKQINGVTINKNKIRFVDIDMQSSMTELEAFEVVDYEVPLISKDQTTSGGTITSEEIRPWGGSRFGSGSSKSENIAPREDFVIELAKSIEREEFKIEGSNTIHSQSKMTSLKIKEETVEVDYKYYAVPKLIEEAFLTAEITNRKQLNLQSGLSKIYFKGTYTGDAYIDGQNVEDTLQLSLGRDKDIVIERSSKYNTNDRMVTGSKKEYINWEILARNTKSAAVQLVVIDQIPVSARKSVEIELLEAPGAKYDSETGEIKWELLLKANDKAQLDFGVEVKCPKYMKLDIN